MKATDFVSWSALDAASDSRKRDSALSVSWVMIKAAPSLPLT